MGIGVGRVVWGWGSFYRGSFLKSASMESKMLLTDGPVIGPKHVVLSINYYTILY